MRRAGGPAAAVHETGERQVMRSVVDIEAEHVKIHKVRPSGHWRAFRAPIGVCVRVRV